MSVKKVSHPAKFTDSILEKIANIVVEYSPRFVLDPFAGTGKIARIKEMGCKCEIHCVEIEKEYALISEEKVDKWIISDSEKLDFVADGYYDAIVTSPVYGNRMSDHSEYNDGTRHYTYRVGLGRALDEENTGRMNWGKRYRDKHERLYASVLRLLKPGGIFVLNTSNHIRKWKEVDVTGWHTETLKNLGLKVDKIVEAETPRLRHGVNHEKRVDVETISVLIKP